MNHRDILALARRIESPTPVGTQVWHVWNEGAGRPLILLHGGSGSWTHWVANVQGLSAQRAVYALDLPGFGDSDLPPGARDVDGLYQAVAQGIIQLLGPGPHDIMGFSFGGMTAGFIAAEQLGLDFHPPNGESPREVMQRLSGFTAELAQAGRPLVAVSHKAAIRALLASGKLPPPVHDKRCKECSLQDLCQPEAMAATSKWARKKSGFALFMTTTVRSGSAFSAFCVATMARTAAAAFSGASAIRRSVVAIEAIV